MSDGGTPGACPWCSTPNRIEIHPVGSKGCSVKAIQYRPDGTVERVEFKGEDDVFGTARAIADLLARGGRR